MTSRFEGMPMSLIEAASYSLPCFATEGTYMADKIEECNAGWTCETTVDGIASTLLKLIEDKGEFINKGVNAYNMALKYSWDELAKLAHEEFSKIINQN